MSETWIDILKHTLGAGSERKANQKGYRNFFCVSTDSPKFKVLQEMVKAGLMEQGIVINSGQRQYFHANEFGCKAIGFSHEEIRRAIYCE